MRRPFTDPRIRTAAAIVVVVLAVALSWHLVAMGLHGMAMLGLCAVALAAAAVLVVPGITASPALAVSTPLPARRPTGARIAPVGRHPPDEGIRLRH